ncbi:uridine-cytidine kinase C-like protein [Tanacetum coccineum]
MSRITKRIEEALYFQVVQNSLAEVRLIEPARVRARSYSGGIKCRLSVAVSLIGDPKLAILDEQGTSSESIFFFSVCHHTKTVVDPMVLTLRLRESFKGMLSCPALGAPQTRSPVSKNNGSQRYLCVAVVVMVSMWLSSILRKVSSVDLAFLPYEAVAAATATDTPAYKKLKAVVAATATDTPGFVVYPMYKAFIEPDLKTAHIRIMNKFNPVTGFQSPTYIFKSSRNLIEDQVKSVMSDEHTQTLEETYDIYLLPPGADSETCESYLRIRNREGRYSLMFEVVVEV